MRVNAGPDTFTGWFGAIFGLGPVEKCQQSGGNGLVRWSNQQSTRKLARETPRSPAWTTFDAPKTVAEPLPLLSFSLFVGRCRREPWAKPTATTANATVSEISCCRRQRLEEPLEEVCPDRDCANLLHFGVKLICPRELPENLIPSPPPPLKSHRTGSPSQGSSGNLAVFVGVARPQERREAFREVLPVRNAGEGSAGTVRFN